MGRHAVDRARAAGPDGRQAGRSARRSPAGSARSPGTARTSPSPTPSRRSRTSGTPARRSRRRSPSTSRAGASGDVQIPAEHHAAVEAAYQLRKKGGVLGRDRRARRAAVVEAMVARPDPDIAARDGRSAPGRDRPRRVMQSGPAGPTTGSLGRRSGEPWVRSCCGSSSWRAGSGSLLFGIGLVLSIAVPVALPIGLLLMVAGPLAPALTLWSMSAEYRRGPW